MSSLQDWSIELLPGAPEICGDPGTVLRCKEREAFQLLETGHGRLLEKPGSPPHYFLEELKKRIGELDLVGPEVTAPKDLSKIAGKVVDNGVVQTLVGGTTLKWARGKVGLRQLVGRRLSQSTDSSVDMFAQFQLATRGGLDWRQTSFPSIEDRIYGLECERGGSPSPNGWPVILMNGEPSVGSAEFAGEILKLQNRLEKAIHSCMVSGRVISVHEKNSKDRFLAPEAAAEIKTKDFDDAYLFLAASDLPADLLSANQPLHVAKRKAQRWLDGVLKEIDQRKKQASQEDLITVIRERFNLTQNAAMVVTKTVARPKHWRAGRIPKNLKIKLSEIKEIN